MVRRVLTTEELEWITRGALAGVTIRKHRDRDFRHGVPEREAGMYTAARAAVRALLLRKEVTSMTAYIYLERLPTDDHAWPLEETLDTALSS